MRVCLRSGLFCWSFPLPLLYHIPGRCMVAFCLPGIIWCLSQEVLHKVRLYSVKSIVLPLTVASTRKVQKNPLLDEQNNMSTEGSFFQTLTACLLPCCGRIYISWRNIFGFMHHIKIFSSSKCVAFEFQEMFPCSYGL